VSDWVVAMHDVISQPPLDQQKLRALLEAAERLTSTLSRDDVLNHILAIGGELTASEAGSVILYDPDQNNLYFAAATGPSAEQVRALRIPIGKGKAGMVFETGEPLIENTLKDHYKAVDQKAHFTTHSMICVPLVFATKTYGVLQFVNKHPDQGPYDDADLQLTLRLANFATIAIRNADLFERLLASSGLYANPEVRKDLVDMVTGAGPRVRVEHATVLFADMRGFTDFCPKIAGSVQDYLNEYFCELAAAVLAHGGIVNKFLGDGLMALFRGPDAPLRAVQCAFNMRERFATLRRQWQMQINHDISTLEVGVGIASDQVTIGAIGDDKMSDFTIVGGVVNHAAALERQARDGSFVLCDNRTYQAVHPWVSEFKGPMGTGGYLIYDLRTVRSSIQRATAFICHAHADLAKVKELIVPYLDKYGFDAFLAEKSIEIGAKWDKAIGAAIDASDYFVIAVSANAVASTHVGEEIHYAFSRERDKRPGWIMPVLLDTTNPSQVYWQLGRRQYRDLTSTDGIADFETALQAMAARARENAANGDRA
jgi:adenylate cyclase